VAAPKAQPTPASGPPPPAPPVAHVGSTTAGGEAPVELAFMAPEPTSKKRARRAQGSTGGGGRGGGGGRVRAGGCSRNRGGRGSSGAGREMWFVKAPGEAQIGESASREADLTASFKRRRGASRSQGGIRPPWDRADRT
jgi:hypothetical protein